MSAAAIASISRSAGDRERSIAAANHSCRRPISLLTTRRPFGVASLSSLRPSEGSARRTSLVARALEAMR